MKKYYYSFGYHSPSAWDVMKADPEFDFESCGVFEIEAESSSAAKLWGEELAKWYIEKLFAENLAYVWSPKNYGCSVEENLPSGWESAIGLLGGIRYRNYPDFYKVKNAFND
ncbi:hypothetical protein [Cerasicoccus maritimus]|uniref:hypothetical protein n=1 Tax=Cerasicoccus maritimus TaxID=490089 RepID=UPI0028526E33|nr:hypothetical protein [Cerasicoccus maritimus]